MCGIAGIVSPGINSLAGNLESMKRRLAHRGPDEHATAVHGKCGMVHARLSIVDLAGGKQPMTTPEGRYTITFNGEIYGYKGIRDGLDYSFESNSDTEVILALYQRYGVSMLDHLPGMFSFAIWDAVDETLFCARDRFGEKPFYYCESENGDFVFASEIKSILASGLISPSIDSGSVHHYLRKLFVHPTRTIYSNIHTLSPGHYLVYSREGRLSKRYWEFPVTENEIGMPEAREKLVSLLDDAVTSQLVADVPVSSFLSGGLDSSSIVAVAAGKTSSLTTLCYRMDGGLDEGDYSRAVAELYNTNHVEMRSEKQDLSQLLIRMAEVYDEPFADSSNIPTYLICEQARLYGKVVLTGDGADELFGGYADRYQPLLRMISEKRRSVLPRVADYILARIWNKIAPSAELWQKSQGLSLSLRHDNICSGLDASYSFFEAEELESMGFPGHNYSPTHSLDGSINDALKCDMSTYMAGDILVKTDRAAMAHGLELRAPFLDRNLAEFVVALPGSLKIDLKQDKKILREAFEHRWPGKVQGRGKQGFGAPVEKWLAQPSVSALVDRYLAADSRINSVVPRDLVAKYGKSGNYKTWILLNLSIWLEHRLMP